MSATNTAQYTSGPWHVEGPDPRKRNPNVGSWTVESEHINVANLCTHADACLIAAAPDLLAALKVAQKLAASGPAPLPPCDPRWAQIADAIAKAAG